MVTPPLEGFDAERMAALCRRYHVRELSLFGSMARGEASPQSDIDLLVEFLPDAPVGFLTLAGLSEELSALLARRVDLVPRQGLKPAIHDEVLAEARVIYAV